MSRNSNGAGNASIPLFGLAPGGVYLDTAPYDAVGGLLHHLFTLTSRNRNSSRRFISVALSIGVVIATPFQP